MHNIVLDVPVRALGLAPVASQWLMKFWPRVHVDLQGNRVTLSSASIPDDRLLLLWTAALANEVTFAQASEQREEILRELIA